VVSCSIHQVGRIGFLVAVRPAAGLKRGPRLSPGAKCRDEDTDRGIGTAACRPAQWLSPGAEGGVRLTVDDQDVAAIGEPGDVDDPQVQLGRDELSGLRDHRCTPGLRRRLPAMAGDAPRSVGLHRCYLYKYKRGERGILLRDSDLTAVVVL